MSEPLPPVERPSSPPPPRVVAAAPVAQPAVPRFPPLAARLAHFTFRPESWAEALRFPFSYTLVPLILAILIAGVMTGGSYAAAFYRDATGFADAYDAHYTAMEYKDKKLTPIAEAAPVQPIRIETRFGLWVIDPAGQVKADEFKDKNGTLIGPTHVSTPGLGATWPLEKHPLFWNIPDGTRIDGAYLKSEITGWTMAVAVWGSVASLFGNAAWAALMIFAVGPVARITAASLQLRQKVAYRAVAAAIVPLVLLGGVLAALGISPAGVIPADFVPVFWFLATVLLAAWAGMMAVRMYKPRRSR